MSVSFLHVIRGKGWELFFFFCRCHNLCWKSVDHMCGLFIGIYVLCNLYWEQLVNRKYSIWFFKICFKTWLTYFCFLKSAIGNLDYHYSKRGNCFLWACEERPVAKECHFEFIEQSAFQWLEMLLLPNLYLSIMGNKWQNFCVGNEEEFCLSRCLSVCCAVLSLVLGF